MYGTTPAGDTSDVWAFHPASGTWRRIEARIRDNVPRHDAGYWSAAGKLFVYGGRTGERILGGLWMVDLSSLRGEMVGERGPRAGAGLFCDAAARTIYLYGGEGPAGLMNDLQRYDLRRRAWEVLGDRRGEVPPAMAGAGLLVSPVDGAITVLAGSSGERREALWQLGPSGWRSHRRIMGGER